MEREQLKLKILLLKRWTLCEFGRRVLHRVLDVLNVHCTITTKKGTKKWVQSSVHSNQPTQTKSYSDRTVHCRCTVYTQYTLIHFKYKERLSVFIRDSINWNRYAHYAIHCTLYVIVHVCSQYIVVTTLQCTTNWQCHISKKKIHQCMKLKLLFRKIIISSILSDAQRHTQRSELIISRLFSPRILFTHTKAHTQYTKKGQLQNSIQQNRK